MENLGAIGLTQIEGWHLLSRTNEDGSVSQIRLSDDDMLVLAQSAQSIRAAINAKHSRPGAEAVVLSTVTAIELGSDHHDTEAYMTMIGDDGTRTGYRLTFDVAETHALNFPRLFLQLATAAKNRTNQQ